MARAIQLARRGLYSSDPNPRVGCVLVKDAAVLAEGWHQRAGGPHAEIDTLNKLKADPKGSTCYVSLEPCVHQGRTQPCTVALISAGITRVIAATTDPNPLVSGQGLQQLRKAGLMVESGLMKIQAQAINPGFNMRMLKSRPWVRCKLAMSLDGKTALANGESRWISSAESRSDVQRLRARSSAVMTSASTVLADNPCMNVRGIDTLGRQPLRVILDSKLVIPKGAKIINLPGDSLIFTRADDNQKKALLEATGAHLVTLEETESEAFLQAALYYLAREKAVNELLLEAGPTLAGKMMEINMIDEIILYIAPSLLGNDAKSLFKLPVLKKMTERVQLEFSDFRQVGRDIRITAKIST